MSPPPDDRLDLSALRTSYRAGALSEADVAADWLTQFRRWFAAAAADPAVVEVNAIQVATVDADGVPDVRTVLAKSVDADGVTFFTNRDSAKGLQLRSGRAALVFSWLSQQRQVRMRGACVPVDRAVDEAYFATRPRGSQLGAWASAQSRVLTGRVELDAAAAAAEQRFAGAPIPVPPNWGGYLLTPSAVEFWQGRDNRLHDRLRFRDNGSQWVLERLAP